MVDTLDLVCKDAAEFELWTSILIGLFERTIPDDILLKATQIASSERLQSVDFNQHRMTSSKTLVSDNPKSRNSGTAANTSGSGIGTGTGTIKSRMKNSQKELLKEAFTNQNEIYTCGWNEWGQSSVGHTEDLFAPSVVHSLLGKGVSNASIGWSHCVIVLDSGNVFQSGNKLGTGLDTDTTNAVEMDTFGATPTSGPSQVQLVHSGLQSFTRTDRVR